MSEFTRLSFIGAGNLAWHLAPALENCGYSVTEVYSRNKNHAEQLIGRLYNSAQKTDLDFSDSRSEYFFLTVSDDSIEEIAKEIILPDRAILIHCSGSVSIETLTFSAANELGVFYPLQTFSKDQKIDFSDIPILIEASDKSIEKELSNMARSLTKHVHYANSEDRMHIHLAAVFACNFTNHLLTKSKEILDSIGYDFKILKPLVVETITKSLKIGPENAQTGPAIRQDFRTLDNHIQILDDEESLKKIYKLITQDIIDHYS